MLSVVVWRQHFQTASPLKPLGRLGPNFICSILGLGDWKFVFHENRLFSLVAMATKEFPQAYNGENRKMALTAKPLQIFWQNFYRNVLLVVLYQVDDFLPSAHFDWLPWEPKLRKEKKFFLKITSSETIWNIGLRLCRNILCISLYKFCVFLLLLLKNSGCFKIYN